MKRVQRTFSFAIGNIWRWDNSENRNALIDYVRDLDVTGIELTLATKKDLYSFKLSNENTLWLKKLDYVTIHAPFNLFKESENEKDVYDQLDTMVTIYHQVDAKRIIIHPEPKLIQSDILKGYPVQFSIENLPRKHNFSISFVKTILDKYPHMDMCLDTSHAYSWSKYETCKLIQAFMKKISQIHFSGSYRKKMHVSLRKVSKNFLYSIQPLKYLDVPIVIEEDLEIKSLKYVRQELEYIKRLFKALWRQSKIIF
jgi:sugar phosphate isomerase/epimerase